MINETEQKVLDFFKRYRNIFLTLLILSLLILGWAFYSKKIKDDLYMTKVNENIALTENFEYSEAGDIVMRVLADEPKNINTEGTIIGYRTFARYVVLGDNKKAKLRGWVIEGPEGEGVLPSNANEVTTYPHKYDIGQRVIFSGKLVPELSWCGEYAQEFILEAGVQTAPITDQQCFGWVDADTVEVVTADTNK